ncbi:hypothetical protein O6H91_Y141200 [Diphasiastrum complanatum]|nr:hypothetical protein O6H91_Y141200 [Diphasiastrum complanatum]
MHIFNKDDHTKDDGGIKRLPMILEEDEDGTPQEIEHEDQVHEEEYDRTPPIHEPRGRYLPIGAMKEKSLGSKRLYLDAPWDTYSPRSVSPELKVPKWCEKSRQPVMRQRTLRSGKGLWMRRWIQSTSMIRVTLLIFQLVRNPLLMNGYIEPNFMLMDRLQSIGRAWWSMAMSKAKVLILMRHLLQ